MPQYNWTVWMQEAIKLAEKALPKDIPVGALVLQHASESMDSEGFKLIGSGWNTREADNLPCGHAEVMALTQAAKALGSWRLTNCTLVVTLEPCPMCAAMLMQCRVGHIVYGATSPLEGAMGSALNMADLYGYNPTVIGGVCEPEIQVMLKEFFSIKR